MKRVFLVVAILYMAILNCYAQEGTGMGFAFSYATENAASFDFRYKFEYKHRAHIGFAYQFNGQKRKVVSEREANFGLTEIEDGDFFWLVDIGYSYIIANKFVVHPELSIGGTNEFTSYKDGRFSDGGYSLITDKKSAIGGGLYAGYLLGESQVHVEPFLGYHSLKGVTFGLALNVDL